MFSKRILLVVILALAVVAGVPMAFAEPSSDLTSVTKPNALEVNELATFESPKGAAGSGWKPDTAVASGANTEFEPSMGSYVDPGTGAVTLYVAYARWVSAASRYEGALARSFNRGATWSLWWWFNWGGHHIRNPSLVVNAYNNTVFIATERYPTAGGDSEIDVWRFAPGHWEVHSVDNDADDDRYPSLTIEYSWITNWLFVSYERVVTSDDRDLYVARSTNWGVTWTTTLLRGTGLDTTVYTQSDIAYAQGNVYIAYRHSTDYATDGHIDVTYSTNYGGTWTHKVAISGPIDASWPSIAGSRAGSWQEPTTLWIAFENETTDDDILTSWSKDYGDSWSTPRSIAGTSNDERRPQLAVDGMGTEDTNVGGNFHLAYWTSESTATRTGGIYYTQIPFNEPDWRPDPQVFGFTVPWSTPKAQIIDNNAWASFTYTAPTIATFTRTVGAETLWMPGIAWTDFRNPSYDIYYTTLDTMFSVTFYPSSQTVEAGKSLSYHVTVNLISGATATATLTLTGRHVSWSSRYIWKYTYSPSTLTPTDTSLLTMYTENSVPAGTYFVNASAVIGGYRRLAEIPFTVTAPPTLTLNINPSTVAKGAPLTISGQLSPALGSPQTIYLYYRFPHQTGSWTLGTTMTTNAAGAYSITPTIPGSAPVGAVDLATFWVNLGDGSYATSPIRVLTITP